jgi:hypothetical protein
VRLGKLAQQVGVSKANPQQKADSIIPANPDWGGASFFTVNLAGRSRALRVDHVAESRNAVRVARQNHPFAAPAWEGFTRSPARYPGIAGGRWRRRDSMEADRIVRGATLSRSRQRIDLESPLVKP